MAEINTATLIEKCKIGLNITVDSQLIDSTVKQKLMTVKGYMLGAGVTEEKFNSELAVGIIVMGVSDLWQLNSGQVKFSAAFNTMLNQLAMG